MPAGNPYYAYLLRRYMEDRCTPGEREELFVLLEQEGSETHWHELISEMMEEEDPSPDYDPVYWEPLLQSILQRPKAKVRNLRVWYAAAAVVMLMLVVGWLFLVRSPGTEDGTASAEARSAQADVLAPAINKAIVTLSDGRTVSLDSIQNGLLANQNGAQLFKQQDGSIRYEQANSQQLEANSYNTLTNPRGSKVIDLTLSDGTRVWLNAGSSLRYPASFASSRSDRQVEIQGEAYFEVTHDPNKPFYVNKGDVSVKVLGTHFNVNAYDDEAEIRVTLLEGKVSVSAFAGATADKSPGVPSRPRALAVTLSPGQQAIATHDSRLTSHDEVDLEQVMAWKNGFFSFRRIGLEDMMRQLTRWYDVDVVYEGAPPAMEFGGELERSLSLSQVLTALEKSKVKFRLEGKKIIVSK